METTCDNALAERLRREDSEQFHTLVRMHLSFVLDLNTDDCEYSSEKVKSRLQKWGFVPFSKKGKCIVKGVMEGAPLTQEGICQVYQLIEFLGKEQNVCQEGIFRRSGKITRQQELKLLLNQGVPLNLDDGHFSVHDCASVLKNFLAELPESLLTDAHYPAYCQIAEMCGGIPGSSDQQSGRNSESRLLRALQLLFLLLPVENRVLLKDILQLLHLTASHEGKNKMSAESLATLFTPHLLCPRKLSPEAIHVNSQTMSGVIAFMIQQGTTLFNIPPKLATDIRAYLAERERRKLPQKKELNESVCDGTAANTIFSFVDRERTALAHVVNPTEAALAQLYAHIQSLPESSKKKKLIKQFNKENGQGTPLQVNMRRKNHLRSKSLGDSIKKHIFHKGIKQGKSNNTQSQFNGSRSLSQEILNKPGTCMKLFQKSMEEDSHSYVGQHEMTGMHKSHMSSMNCVPLQLQYTVLDNCKPQRHSDSSNNKDITHHGNEITATEEILQNLASQIVANHHDDKTNEFFSGSILESRKRVSTTSSESSCENSISPPKATCCSADLDLPSSSHTPTTPCQSLPENQGTNIWPVSNPAAALPASCCDFSVDCQTALPGFFSSSPLLGHTNSRLTPRNALTCFLTTSTPASQSRLRVPCSTRGPIDANHSSCLLTPIADENNSMSPITRSTQKMSKAMQETMMTPRCRKPVVLLSGSNLCQLANISTLGTIQKHFCHEGNSASCNSTAEDKEIVNNKEDWPVGTCNTSYSMDCDAVKTVGNNTMALIEDEEEKEDFKTADICSTLSKYMPSDSGSLTSTFRTYLLSRSVLTASPVDLSFSSRTGDFDTSDSNNEKILERGTLSTSLLYCLDGNQPSISDVTDKQENDVYSSCCSDSRDSGILHKEQVVMEAPRVCETNLQSCSTSKKDNGKICEVTSSKAALISNSEQFSEDVICETSL